ncbi:hypothetical protein PCANC_24263 [Puccinia coronata f. sp. avenae]|uniref:Uncharacterized protein n=1 Tax=Puccinia coronata f. sp. avenae TaxID=200324 RepID=A0A2N5S311_9BASI|nr:hypothetical protein PCANC_24263 [Puccinia coronata f. sp. avenae]PLW39935.1 hypothetical protein PCASD_06853 [Puccinia coronata f. sp. avenae]
MSTSPQPEGPDEDETAALQPHTRMETPEPQPVSRWVPASWFKDDGRSELKTPYRLRVLEEIRQQREDWDIWARRHPRAAQGQPLSSGAAEDTSNNARNPGNSKNQGPVQPPTHPREEANDHHEESVPPEDNSDRETMSTYTNQRDCRSREAPMEITPEAPHYENGLPAGTTPTQTDSMPRLCTPANQQHKEGTSETTQGKRARIVHAHQSQTGGKYTSGQRIQTKETKSVRTLE